MRSERTSTRDQFPPASQPAARLVALMAGALAFRIRVRDTIPLLLGDAAVLALAAVMATLRALAG